MVDRGKHIHLSVCFALFLDKGRGVWKFGWINQRENLLKKGKKKCKRITLQRRRSMFCPPKHGINGSIFYHKKRK